MTQGRDPMSGGSGSGTYYAPTFSAGQQVAVIYKNTSGQTVKVLTDALTAEDISNEGKSATINVTINDADKTQPLTYIYPATMANDDGTVNYGTFNFTAQSGTEAPFLIARLLHGFQRLGRQCAALSDDGQPDSHLEALDDIF